MNQVQPRISCMQTNASRIKLLQPVIRLHPYRTLPNQSLLRSRRSLLRAGASWPSRIAMRVWHGGDIALEKGRTNLRVDEL